MSSTTPQVFASVASTTGQLIQDGFPLWIILAGALFAIFGIMLFMRSIRAAARKVLN